MSASATLLLRELAQQPLASRGAWLRARLGARWCVVALLLLPSAFGIAHFGPRAALVLSTSVLLCVGLGILVRQLEGRPWRLLNAGTIVTGLLLGLTLSADTPLYMILFGAAVAELVGKLPLPGLGRNLFNPAALGRAAVAICEIIAPPQQAVDVLTAPSPLFKDAGGYLPPHLADLLLGLTPGAIGETSALVLLLAGAPMVLWVARKRVATVACVVAVALAVALLPPTSDIAGHAPWVLDPIVYVLGSATLLSAFFFLTDPATAPSTRRGAILFGAGVGVLGVLGRVYTTLPGAEMWALLVMNGLTPALDRLGSRPATRSPRPRPPLSQHQALQQQTLQQQALPLQTGDAPEQDTRCASVEPGLGHVEELLPGPDLDAFDVLGSALAEPGRIIAEVARGGLSGCGGGHFPVARKWDLALLHPGPRALIVNGQEGEPGSLKDRFLMQHHPRLVLTGAAIAALALQAAEIVVVIDPGFSAGHRALEGALAALALRHPELAGRFRLCAGPGLYVSGEETALIEFLEGRRPEPQLRPPFPAQRGLHGRPTVVQNVETLAWLPRLLHGGGADFASAGPFKLVTLTGDLRAPGIYAIRPGTTLNSLLARAGGLADGGDLLAFAVGGPSGHLVPPSQGDHPLTRRGVGSGAIEVLAGHRDLLAEVLQTADFFAAASCGRCTPCRVGTRQVARLLRELPDRGAPPPDVVQQLEELSGLLGATSTCGLGRAATRQLDSLNSGWTELLRPPPTRS